jgi:DnaJ homolog subfamily C member 7
MMALDFKQSGNEAFKRQEYAQAIQLYTQGLQVESSDVLLSNRAQCYLNLNEYELALYDCLEAMKMGNKKAISRGSVAQIHLGRLEQAKELIQNTKGDTTFVDNLLVGLDRFNDLYEGKEYSIALHHLESLFCELDPSLRNSGLDNSVSRVNTNRLQKIPVKWQICRCQCLIELDVHECTQATMAILRAHPRNSDALLLRAKTMFILDSHSSTDIDSVLRTGLTLDPDHQSIRNFRKSLKKLMAEKDAANDAFKAGKWDDALQGYTELLGQCQGVMGVKIRSNRAIVYAKLGDYDNVVQECTDAIGILESLSEGHTLFTKLYSRRADAYMKQEQFESAINDYEKCVEIDGGRGLLHVI